MTGRILHIVRYLSVVAMLLIAGCVNNLFEPDYVENEYVTVRFGVESNLGLLQTRSISDGSNVNRLLVAVYDGNTHAEVHRKELALVDALNRGVELSLINGHSYKVLFWAYDGENTAYTISDAGVITVSYTDYLTGGFTKMEQLDAFYALSTVSVLSQMQEHVVLTRPFASLNIADNVISPETDIHSSEITLNGVATSFNPFTGNALGETSSFTFTFTDFPGETLVLEGDTYHYIATNYLFIPMNGEVSALCRIKYAGTGELINERSVTSIALMANKRTNVLGSFVQLPEDKWNGQKITEPTKDKRNRYIIDETSDLAWLAQFGSSLEDNSTFVVMRDLNMNNNDLASLQLPQGSTIEGGGYTVRKLSMTGGGLFGDVVDFTLKDITIDRIKVKNAATHIGAVVNTLRGNGAFNNVSVKNATVKTTNGAAGGMVGYAVRKVEQERSERLALTFESCKVENSSVSGSESNGKFVGLFSGYDFNESVSFAEDCYESNVNVNGYVSPYSEGNEGEWLALNDYSKYNGWLGNEAYCRGTVIYGSQRFIPRWDGSGRIEPLQENGTTLIYSAFDLAYLQGGSLANITFMGNVDLGGDKNARNLFTPIKSIVKLDGRNHTLYNLNIYINGNAVGFVTGTSGQTEHKDLHFAAPSVRAQMASNANNIHVAVLCPVVEHKYSAENISITDGYLLGLGKLGALIGYVTSGATGPLTVKSCSVTQTTVKNVESTAKDRFYTIYTLYPQGEAGGLIGYIHGISATISNCSVNNSTIDCYGQNDQQRWLGLGTVWGRHVNDFIGDICSDNSDNRIDLNNNSVENNRFTNRDKDSHSAQCTIVGRCYTRGNTQGAVYINNVKVF